MSNARQPTGELRQALLTFRSAFVTVLAFSLIINLLMLAPAIYMLQVYDRALGSRNVTTLLVLTVIVVGLLAVMSLLEWVRSMILVRLGAKFDLNVNTRVFNAAFERNLRSAGQNPAQALYDLASIRQAMTGAGLIAVMEAPWMPIYLAVIFMFHTSLGIFAVVGALILVALAFANEAVSKEPLAEAQKLAIMANTQANNNLRNAEVIEAMGMLPAIRARWFALQHKLLVQQATASDRAGLMGSITKFARIAMQSLTLGFGCYLAIEGSLTAGMMIAATILVGRALAPLEMLVANWKQLVSARAASVRLTELLGAFPARDAGMSLPAPRGALTLTNASAVPPGANTLVLKNVSLQIGAGEVVAVIGPSASGKSSLARLMVGVWPAINGSVRLDGADIYRWSKDDLGPHIGYLPQDIELFDGTVAENIARFGEVDSDKIVAAAKAAGVHDLVLQLPKGYDTPLGDQGSALSGGQRQRIGLARALYGDPVLIVLDEPNSNLDEVGEQALTETLRGLKEKGCTVIVITHRRSTVGVADKLLVMHEGAPKLFGPRDQVIDAIKQGQAPRRPVPSVSATGTAVAPSMVK